MLDPNIGRCVDPESGGHIFNSFTYSPLNYALPDITPNTLKLESSDSVVTANGRAFFYIPTNELSFWVTFNGAFGHFPAETVVSYFDEAGHWFECDTDSLTTDSSTKEGEIKDSLVLCRTATHEPAGEYHFVVSINGHSSLPGLDALLSPELIVTGVNGCASDQGNTTSECSTVGGDVLSFTHDGSLFAESMVHTKTRLFFIHISVFSFLENNSHLFPVSFLY